LGTSLCIAAELWARGQDPPALRRANRAADRVEGGGQNAAGRADRWPWTTAPDSSRVLVAMQDQPQPARMWRHSGDEGLFLLPRDLCDQARTEPPEAAPPSQELGCL